VREKPPLEAIPSVAKAITDCCLKLGKRGRVVVRYSGTEPLARVMVEGEDVATVEKHTTLIASAIQRAVGLEN
jgi:phosphoglucosamine mutase